MNTEAVMIEAFRNLLDEELKQFTWHLRNGVKPGIVPIPKANLQKLTPEDVVDCMVNQYPDDAGQIAVQALRNMKQNNVAKQLELKLQKIQQPVQEEATNASVSMELQPIQSDWCRPHSITPCSQQFKNILLTQKRNEVYIPTSHYQRKGSALLITNIKFDYISNRNGAEKDEKNMEWLLGALGYSVVKHTNLSGEAIKRAVENFSKRHEHRDSDSTFVVIMSHGDRIDNKDAILGVHFDDRKNPNDYFFVEDIFTHLNSVNCPALIDKPKIIFIQACRGGEVGGAYARDSAFESDAKFESDAWVHKEKDFACFMSSLPDVSAFRDPANGSFFIIYIVDMFSKSAHEYHLMELFTKITSRMVNDPRFTYEKNKLLPCIERMTLEKNFYLFPGF